MLLRLAATVGVEVRGPSKERKKFFDNQRAILTMKKWNGMREEQLRIVYAQICAKW